MSSASADPAQDAMRRTFKQKADFILKGLKSKSKGSYGSADLHELGISLENVQISNHDGPGNQTFPDFKPLSENEFAKYKFVESTLPEHRRQLWVNFENAFNYSLPKPVSEDYVHYERPFQIFRLIKILYSHYQKRTLSMREHSKWYEIRGEDSFLNGPRGMLAGPGFGHSDPRSLPQWEALSYRQWQGDLRKPKTIRPHTILLTCTGGSTKDDELLHGEIGPIVNTIQCRLSQEEFKQTLAFPVLVISLFAPRSGRILQARFNSSGTLVVRASQIFDFRKRNREGFDLFLRYYNCEPPVVARTEPTGNVRKSPSHATPVSHRTTTPGGGEETSATSPP